MSASAEPAGVPGSVARHSAWERAGARLVEFVLGHRALMMLSWAIVVMALGAGIMQARFVPDMRVFFGADNPENRLLNEMEATYARANSILFVVSTGDGDLFTPARLAVLEEMTESAWSIPYVLRVDSIANFNQTTAEDDDIIVEPLYTAADVTADTEAARVRDEALSEESLVDRLVSPDARVAGVRTIVVPPEDQTGAVPEIAAAARALAKEWQDRWPDMDVGLTGGVMADITFAEAGQRDQNELVPVMGALIILLLIVGLNSLRSTLAVLVVIVGAVACALGSAGWIGISMNAATGASPMSIMVLIIASCVHVVFTWSRLAKNGLPVPQALRRSMAINTGPITVTNATTFVGFLCLNFSASPPLADLGNIVAIGIVAGWAMTLTLLPCLLSYLRNGVYVRLLALEGSLGRLADFIMANRRRLVAAFALISVLAGIGVWKVTLDDAYFRYFDESFEFRRESDFAEQHLTGLNVLQFSFDSGSEGGIFEPDFLNRIDRFSEWLEGQNNVVHVDSLAQLIKRLNRTVEGGAEEDYRIGDSREINAQNLLLYELGLPVGHDMNSVIDISRAKTRVTASLRDVSSRDIRQLAARAEGWLQENMPEFATPATGLSVVFAHLSERNIRSMIIGTGLALVFISLMLLPAFGSVKLGLVSLVPNLAPAFFAFGLWGFLVGNVNLAATVVSAMTLGIIVDDTIHLIMKYQRARTTLHQPPDAAMRTTLMDVGLPVIITTVAIGSGFAAMCTSGLQLSQHIGGLSLIIMVMALLADLLLLLPLLLLTDRQTT